MQVHSTTGTPLAIDNDGVASVKGAVESNAQKASKLCHAFSYISIDASGAAGTYPLYLKNDEDSTTNVLVVDKIGVSAVESVLWKVAEVTGTAAGGNELTSTNLNSASLKDDGSTGVKSIARGDDAVTGLTAGQVVDIFRTVATGNAVRDYDGALRLHPGDAIAVEYDTGTTGIAELFVQFHFEAAE